MFAERFIHLAKKLAVDQGFSFAQIDDMARNDIQESRTGLAGRIKLNIDFTKLAKLAHNRKKLRLSEFLIMYERQIVKKIPFLLEVKQYDKAFVIAVDGGDPNNINKVIQEILKSK